MKTIYPNDLCPCRSGKKYKKCCMTKKVTQTGWIGALPVSRPNGNSEFFVNERGAVMYYDESKQPVLEIPEGSITKGVLSVGLNNSRKPIATIQEPEGPVCYILPNWYAGWCQTCVGIAISGTNFFPADVIFAKENEHYSADIL